MKVETLHEGISDITGEKLVVKKTPVRKLNKYKYAAVVYFTGNYIGHVIGRCLEM